MQIIIFFRIFCIYYRVYEISLNIKKNMRETRIKFIHSPNSSVHPRSSQKTVNRHNCNNEYSKIIRDLRWNLQSRIYASASENYAGYIPPLINYLSALYFHRQVRRYNFFFFFPLTICIWYKTTPINLRSSPP